MTLSIHDKRKPSFPVSTTRVLLLVRPTSTLVLHLLNAALCCCYLKACSCSLWVSAVQTISNCVNIVEAKQREMDNCGSNFFLPFAAATWKSYILYTCPRRRWQSPYQKHLVGCCHGRRCGQNSRSYSRASVQSKPRKL